MVSPTMTMRSGSRYVERSQQDGVDDAEDRGVGADAEGEDATARIVKPGRERSDRRANLRSMRREDARGVPRRALILKWVRDGACPVLGLPARLVSMRNRGGRFSLGLIDGSGFATIQTPKGDPGTSAQPQSGPPHS